MAISNVGSSARATPATAKQHRARKVRIGSSEGWNKKRWGGSGGLRLRRTSGHRAAPARGDDEPHDSSDVACELKARRRRRVADENVQQLARQARFRQDRRRIPYLGYE